MFRSSAILCFFQALLSHTRRRSLILVGPAVFPYPLVLQMQNCRLPRHSFRFKQVVEMPRHRSRASRSLSNSRDTKRSGPRPHLTGSQPIGSSSHILESHTKFSPSPPKEKSGYHGPS
ncbi:hypothetical protein BDP55DRAFT_641852 [Colletotrichum godetiae]|uniref:Uncharacterized protein n=1 Tax=Colletotrichum godetiae TaxID=1209918 RepID=A0AAJ0F3C8_9PEZI|nr:uncharacterized protein BDP55DRAFT_641852 [Colletotrichum godetiae]KAK1701536.1 hypothetical protein BDP55DRAFT_641852 [Colletotrichum godetiae]